MSNGNGDDTLAVAEVRVLGRANANWKPLVASPARSAESSVDWSKASGGGHAAA